ncbi:MAG: hypothetical protein KDB14_16395 [Planctomycetales bacterium]|nr:hypothetical protein [Planctomycetales bacterium]
MAPLHVSPPGSLVLPTCLLRISIRSLDYDILFAVELLAEWLRQHRERQVKAKT